RRMGQIVESLKGASVLTVGEMEQFNQQGGIINFLMEENKVGFEINANAAEQARLKISSKLLVLAKRGGGR
ncbi:MAG: YfiR family protein, partial [Blastocatellia bacterium]|nr:YfiR family protein [Blastocatellia bacterium]